MNYASEQIRFDGSIIFRTKPEARWSIYSGIGLSAGFSFNAKTEISYSKSQGTETLFPDGDTYLTYDLSRRGKSESEYFRNQSGFGGSVYIPMGLNFRLGNENEFWQKMLLFYEFRAGINMTSIPEVYTLNNSFIQHGLGLSVKL